MFLLSLGFSDLTESSFSTFVFSYLLILVYLDTDKSIIMQLLSSLFTATMTCFLPSTFLSHCFITSHNMFTSLFSIALSGICTHHLSSLSRLYFPHNFQFTILVTLSCFLLYTFRSKFSH